jgi:transcriptional regulator with XRE-family HTH domain
MANTSFGTRLRKARAAAGYKTARACAEAVGLSENRYARYERGGSEPDYALLCRLCDRLGVTPNDLLGYRPNRIREPRAVSGAPGFADALPPSANASRPASHKSVRSRDVETAPESVDIQLLRLTKCIVDGRVGLSKPTRTPRSSADRAPEIAVLYSTLRADPVNALPRLLTSEDVQRLPPAARTRAYALADAIFSQLAP